jgi:hypothetical protein
MSKRIVLVHAYLHSMAPIDATFKAAWPEAQILNLLDETLYADVPLDGKISEALYGRVAELLQHCVNSRADGVVFTGSTFGPAVERARADLPIPILKADEALADFAVARGGSILLACTQQRAMAVVRPGFDAAAGRAGQPPRIQELWVEGAKAAMDGGDIATHDRMIARAVQGAGIFDTIVLGQISMAGARAYLPPELASRVMTSSDAAVARLRSLVG